MKFGVCCRDRVGAGAEVFRVSIGRRPMFIVYLLGPPTLYEIIQSLYEIDSFYRNLSQVLTFLFRDGVVERGRWVILTI